MSLRVRNFIARPAGPSKFYGSGRLGPHARVQTHPDRYAVSRDPQTAELIRQARSAVGSMRRSWIFRLHAFASKTARRLEPEELALTFADRYQMALPGSDGTGLERLREARQELGLAGEFEAFHGAIRATLLEVHRDLIDLSKFRHFAGGIMRQALDYSLEDDLLYGKFKRRGRVGREAVYRVILGIAAEYGWNKFAKIGPRNLDEDEFRAVLNEGNLIWDYSVTGELNGTKEAHGSESHLIQLLYIAATAQKHFADFGGARGLVRFFGTRLGLDYWNAMFERLPSDFKQLNSPAEVHTLARTYLNLGIIPPQIVRRDRNERQQLREILEAHPPLKEALGDLGLLGEGRALLKLLANKTPACLQEGLPGLLLAFYREDPNMGPMVFELLGLLDEKAPDAEATYALLPSTFAQFRARLPSGIGPMDAMRHFKIQVLTGKLPV